MKDYFYETDFAHINAAASLEVYDEPIDEAFVCPVCGEPILKVDYPRIKAVVDEDGCSEYVCPVCEETF